MSESATPLSCANHPQVETYLRCRRCDKPICAKCAVHTATGYKCRECVRGQQKVFETAAWHDYLIALAVAVPLSYIGALISTVMFFLVIFTAPIAGTLIAEAVRAAVKRRRSQRLFQVAAAGVILGGLPLVLVVALPTFYALTAGQFDFRGMLPLLFRVLYIILATSTMYARLSGIRV
jgi:hypothetical protein